MRALRALLSVGPRARGAGVEPPAGRGGSPGRPAGRARFPFLPFVAGGVRPGGEAPGPASPGRRTFLGALAAALVAAPALARAALAPAPLRGAALRGMALGGLGDPRPQAMELFAPWVSFPANDELSLAVREAGLTPRPSDFATSRSALRLPATQQRLDLSVADDAGSCATPDLLVLDDEGSGP